MHPRRGQVLFFAKKGVETSALIQKVQLYDLEVISTHSLNSFGQELFASNPIMIILENDLVEESPVELKFFYQATTLIRASICLVIGQKSGLQKIQEALPHIDQIIPKKFSTKAKELLLEKYCRMAETILVNQYQIEVSKTSLGFDQDCQKVQNELHKKDRLISTLYLQIIKYKNLLKQNYLHWKSLQLEVSDATTRNFHASLAQNARSIDEDWELFYEHFVQVQPKFFDELKRHSTDLSATNLKMCAYIKIGLSNADIAHHLNILKSSVKRAQTRIKKKLGLSTQETLRKFIYELETID